MTAKPTRQRMPERRADYLRFERIPTRWMDNDAYRHVNNVVYYSFFDTVVNRMLIEAGVLDIAASPAVGLVVETGCSYFSPIAFPDEVHAGMRVAHLGRSSVRYEIGRPSPSPASQARPSSGNPWISTTGRPAPWSS